MTDYLENPLDGEDPELVSVLDELPLWSAPFGLRLLDSVEMKPGLRVLDIGCGTGFPLLELAMRLGASCRVFGIDPWEQAVERVKLKIRRWDIGNAEVEASECEDLPFKDAFFDLQVSNNGINNVRDRRQALAECARTARPGAQMVITMNLDSTMRAFYTVFEEVLIEAGLPEAIGRLQAHIHGKRPPLDTMKKDLETAGFTVIRAEEDEFAYRFLDGGAMLRHFMVLESFLPEWKKIVSPPEREGVFARCEERLNTLARYRGELRMSIPFALLDCRRR